MRVTHYVSCWTWICESKIVDSIKGGTGASGGDGGAGGGGEEAAEASAEAGESHEMYLLRRTRELNAAVRERPFDLQLWLDFAAFQDEAAQCARHHSYRGPENCLFARVHLSRGCSAPPGI